MDSRREFIEVWHPADVPQIELRRGYSVSAPVPRHWHDEYQLCLIQSGGGELDYRGRWHGTPSATLFVVHPGEVHANRATGSDGCSYRTLFLAPELVRDAARELDAPASSPPFFPDAVTADRALVARYLRLHSAFENASSRLEQQSQLAAFLEELVTRFAESPPSPSARGPDRRALDRACDYLRAAYAGNVSLDALARLAGMSPFHFNRAFSARYGMPPHAFQTQLRIARARTLLREGRSIAEVALDTGFADQSHFTRHFRRLSVVTPGRYVEQLRRSERSVRSVGSSAHAGRRSKNVQDPLS